MESSFFDSESEDESESMKSVISSDQEFVMRKFDSMNEIVKRKPNSDIGIVHMNPELYRQLYPLDDLFMTPESKSEDQLAQNSYVEFKT